MVDHGRRAFIYSAGLFTVAAIGGALADRSGARAQERRLDPAELADEARRQRYPALHDAAEEYAPVVVERVYDWDVAEQRFVSVQTVRVYSCAPLSAPNEMLRWAC